MRRRVIVSVPGDRPGTRIEHPQPRPWLGRIRALGVALGLIVLLAPGTALAQELWSVTPSLTAAERYTDNVFGTAHNRQSDFITRITSGIALSYEAPPFSTSLSYAATGEIYADNSELDNFGENQNGSLLLDYRPEERLRLHLAGYYAKTNNPSQFLVPGVAPPGVTPVTTVQTARTQTSQFTLTAGADYHFTPRFSGNAAYTGSYLRQEGTEDSQSHTGTLGGSYQLTRQDQGFSTVSVTYFDTVNSNTSADLLFGWRRQWTPDFTTSVALGPRVTTGGNWAGAANISLTYLPQREWSVMLAYSLGTSLAVGNTNAENVSALRAAIGYRPTRDLEFRAVAGWSRSWLLGGSPSQETTDAYSAGVSASYQFTRWLAFTLDYRFTVENGSQSDTITTNEVVLGLTAASPIRK